MHALLGKLFQVSNLIIVKSLHVALLISNCNFGSQPRCYTWTLPASSGANPKPRLLIISRNNNILCMQPTTHTQEINTWPWGGVSRVLNSEWKIIDKEDTPVVVIIKVENYHKKLFIPPTSRCHYMGDSCYCCCCQRPV